jgi:hypothetical protein
MIPVGLAERLRSHPKRLFAIDGAGALLSAFLLGVVLVRFQSVFGIPRSTLVLLAALPCLFALVDLWVVVGVRRGFDRWLRRIAVANLGYCGLSLGLAFAHREVITLWGWAYIVGEVGIVAALAVVELGVARRIEQGVDEPDAGRIEVSG